MLMLFSLVVLFERLLSTRHRLFELWLKSHLSRYRFHLSRRCLFTNWVMLFDSSRILGSDGFSRLSASLSSASVAASVGKFGRISLMQPDGMFLLVVQRMNSRRVRSPLCTSVGCGVFVRSSSSCSLNPSQFALAKLVYCLLDDFVFTISR